MCRSKFIHICLAAASLCTPFNTIVAQSWSTSHPTGYGPFDGNEIRWSPGAPFVGTSRQTAVKLDADGSAQTTVKVGGVARDSDGRLSIAVLPDGPFPDVWNVIDPSKQTALYWTGDAHQAVLYHDPRMVTVKSDDDKNPTPWPLRWQNDVQSNWQVEQLGTKMIRGILVEGKRATRDLPKNKADHDQQTAISEEMWYSRDLQAFVSSIFKYSQGTVTVELADIERKEPDPKLFMAPSSYEIIAKEMTTDSAPAGHEIR